MNARFLTSAFLISALLLPAGKAAGFSSDAGAVLFLPIQLIIKLAEESKKIPPKETHEAREAREAKAMVVSAEQGKVDAQIRLSWMYAHGYGVARDDVEASRWLRTAAENRHSMSQFQLGQRYENGVGLVQDYRRAYAWYDVAIASGIGAAKAWQNGLEPKMTAEEIIEAKNLAGEFREKFRGKGLLTVEPGPVTQASAKTFRTLEPFK